MTKKLSPFSALLLLLLRGLALAAAAEEGSAHPVVRSLEDDLDYDANGKLRSHHFV